MQEDKNINTIGQDFTIFSLIKYTLPPILAALFRSLLSTIDDTLFISRYCGEYALGAFSLFIPLLMFINSIVTMLGASAIKCSMLMGEGKNDDANKTFTSITIITLCFGLFFSLILGLFGKEIMIVLGATDILLPYIMDYIDVFFKFVPLFCLNGLLSRFYAVAGKPKLSVVSTVLSVICNFLFDWLFIVKMKYGISGAAYANLLSDLSCVTLAFFVFTNNKSEIHLTKPSKAFGSTFLEICKLGIPDSVSFLAYGISGVIANYMLLYFGSEDYVSAYAVTDNMFMLFANSFYGLFGSTSPIISYAYGEKNSTKLVKTFYQIAIILTGLTTAATAICILFRNQILGIYLADYENLNIVNLAHYGMKIVPWSFLIYGYNLMVQEYAIAVGNTKVSTKLTILENLVFINITTVVLPIIFGVKYIWFNFLSAELLTLCFSIIEIYKNRNNYGYGKEHKASFIDD